MQKFSRFFLILNIIMVVAWVAVAQDDTDTTTSDETADETTVEEQSTVDFVFHPCSTEVVMDFSGFMQPGYDLYYQAFLGADAQAPLTALQRVTVNDAYQTSDVSSYNAGTEPLLAEMTASATIRIASESDPEDSVFVQTVTNTVTAECVEPAFPVGVSTIATGSTTIGGGTTATVDPATLIGTGAAIYSPLGGVLNPDYRPNPVTTVLIVEDDTTVVIGARTQPSTATSGSGGPSDRRPVPGVVFAECSTFPGSDPGLLYDTDTIIVFWSWFATTPELVEDHIRAANYAVGLNGQPMTVEISPITRKSDGNYWVFYAANLGNFQPGSYGISFFLDWTEPISDGYAEYGPGTANPSYGSGCPFEIFENPWGVAVIHDNPSIPMKTVGPVPFAE